jgi:NAD(P)-dependent dehydrogenase (short-subunit alcohol dehydrogenase family)
MMHDDVKKRGMSYEAYIEAAANRPMGRVGTPDEIAKVALFLATDDSSFMTGSIVAVDGGGTA